MSNEVAKAFDELFLDFVERNKVQLWYDKHWKTWTVQCPKPFTQVTHSNLKGAITKLMGRLGELKLKNDNP